MSSVFRTGVVLVALLLFCGQAPVFRSGVDLVSLNVTVIDPRGRAVGDLPAGAFAVFENGHRRPIAQFSRDPQPISLVVAVDTSFSMRGARFERARAVVVRLVEHIGPRDEVCVYGFNDRAFLVSDWADRGEGIDGRLQAIVPDGNTALYDTVTASLGKLAHSVNPKRAVVIISDGHDRLAEDRRPDGSHFTPSSRRFMSALASVRESEALVYTIGIDAPNTGGHDALDPSSLRTISDSSGAYSQVVQSLDDLDRAGERIIAELRQQYLIGFPPEALDGKFHDVTVVVQGCAGCSVRNRPGFIARRRSGS